MSPIGEATLDARLAAALPSGPTAICDVLLPHVASGLSPEDPPLPSELLQSVARACESAGMTAATQNQPVLVGIAQLGRAAALMIADSAESLQAAERSLLHALPMLNNGAPAWIRRDAFLLLCDWTTRAAPHIDPSARDAFVGRGLAVARAAEYLAALDGAQTARARSLAAQALLEAERFGSVRDRHLMNSLDHAQTALARLSDAEVRAAVRWPILMLKMGNAAMNIAPSRALWLEWAQRFYTLGRAAVDAQRYPRLADMFDRNLALWNDDGAAQLEAELPPAERRARAARDTERSDSAAAGKGPTAAA